MNESKIKKEARRIRSLSQSIRGDISHIGSESGVPPYILTALSRIDITLAMINRSAVCIEVEENERS